MRRTGALLAILGVLAWVSCATPEPIETSARVRLRLPRDLDCRPTWSRLVVQALGDFPASEEYLDGFVPADMTAFGNDRFPWDTRALTVRGFAVEEVSGGVLSLGASAVEGDVLLLPYGQPCVLAAAFAPDQSASIALPDGGLLVVGGGDTDVDATRKRVARLAPGSELFDITAALYNPRFGASATVAHGEVVIAGGGFGRTGPVQSNFEVYDLATSTVRTDPAFALCDGRGRRDHGAVRLSDGRVLLVGGIEADGGVPRDDAEILDAATGCVERIDGDGSLARALPTVVSLDDGKIVVLGGRSSSGQYQREPAVFDAQARVFYGLGDPFPRYEDAAIVALPGGRVAAFGGLSRATAGDPMPVSSVSVLLPDETIADLGPLVTPALRHVRAAALADGTVLVTGSIDEAGAVVLALVIDVGRAVTREVEPTPGVPTVLVALADGAVASLDASGASLRREQLLTPFDNPPSTLLQGDTQGVAVDAYPRWESSTGFVRALRAGARIDLPTLRFGRFRAELDADAGASLLIQRENSYAESVPLLADTAGTALCDVERVGRASLHVERDGDTLRISAGGATRTCRVNPLGDRVSLAVTARVDTVIRALRVARY